MYCWQTRSLSLSWQKWTTHVHMHYDFDWLWVFMSFIKLLWKSSKQDTRYLFCLLKSSMCQIRWLKSHKFLLCRGQETWQTCSLINHWLLFMTCVMSPARKRSLLTTTTTDKPLWEVNKVSNMLVFLSWGVLDTTPVETIDCCATCSLIISEPVHCPTSSWSAVIWLISCSLTPA